MPSSKAGLSTESLIYFRPRSRIHKFLIPDQSRVSFEARRRKRAFELEFDFADTNEDTLVTDGSCVSFVLTYAAATTRHSRGLIAKFVAAVRLESRPTKLGESKAASHRGDALITHGPYRSF